MKKLMLLLVIFLLIPSVFTYAKHKKKQKKSQAVLPVVRMGHINSYMTTREEILSMPKLTIDSACAIAGFSISLVAPGHDFFGPLYVHGDEMNDLQKGKIKEWDYPNVTIYIEDIHCNCHEQDFAPPAIVLKYDH
jgi:hypothetical protein